SLAAQAQLVAFLRRSPPRVPGRARGHTGLKSRVGRLAALLAAGSVAAARRRAATIAGATARPRTRAVAGAAASAGTGSVARPAHAGATVTRAARSRAVCCMASVERLLRGILTVRGAAAVLCAGVVGALGLHLARADAGVGRPGAGAALGRTCGLGRDRQGE